MHREITKINKASSNVGSIVSPIPIHDQAAASPLSLQLPEVPTYAHINKLMIIAKGEKPHTNTRANRRVS